MPIELTPTSEDTGVRLDHFLHAHMTQFSRSRLQQWIRSGRVLVNGIPVKPSLELRGGERVTVDPEAPRPLHAEPEDLPLDVLYQDAAVIALNKPAGVAVHAGAGHHSGTLANRLVHHFRTLSSVAGDQRPGIVHRLDKQTSGVLLVARTDAAHRGLADQFAGRSIEKTYLALVQGRMKSSSGSIDLPIARDPVHRTRMTARLGRGRTAQTSFRVLREFSRFSLLEVRIGTGRTHQIRVHLASLGNPVAGDKLYGAKEAVDLPPERFFLHAYRIRFVSPATGEPVTVEAPLAPDLESALLRLI
ncbi:MAG: RluA family pseudouridine synthase [Bryobacteraceae bacterium]|nr:RluA family pseudouridine synthase [Bryobacteraceae bacterium]